MEKNQERRNMNQITILKNHQKSRSKWAIKL